ncbi:hypothetical protein Glove_300g79 [Diversispora epigaea]|uniref:Uncharacterized protein n=1 Tax=Diversispora epigaea TaxID=1348612 RepID=A0A397I2F6_9GLOM|nr:hypothetical protein Glove_300g79 [Diversispora epigaea]
MKNQNQDQQEFNPMIHLESDLFRKENLLLNFKEPEESPVVKYKYTTKCCLYNEKNHGDDDDNDSFYEYLTDDGIDCYECFHCKRAKYEEKKRRQGVEVKRKR